MCPVVDEDNNVVGSVPRSQLVAGRLLGRGVYCVVLNAAGDVFVSKRADSKDVWPGRYDTVIAGVVQTGESYDDTAIRELSEELGIHIDDARAAITHRLGCFRWQDVYCDVWGAAYVARLAPHIAGSLKLQATEVAGGQFLPLEQVREVLQREQATPVGQHVLEMYLTRVLHGKPGTAATSKRV